MEHSELDVLLEHVIEVAVELLPATAASLLLWDTESETFSVSATTVVEQSRKRVLETVRTTGGASRWIVDHQEHLAVADIADDPFGASTLLRAAELGAYLGVPLVFEGDALGVLYALDRGPRSYRDDDVDFMAVLARRAASAIGFNRLLQTTRELATTDDLTGISNRREFFDRGRAELARAARTDRPLTVILIDIDDFKAINDRRGHVAGDAVLRAVADRCVRTIRSIDVFGRLGGEEFGLLVPDVGVRAAAAIAERLRRQIVTTPVMVDAHPVPITITAGIACSRPDDTLHALVDRADRAMYAGKRAGRNRVVVDDGIEPPTSEPPGTRH